MSNLEEKIQKFNKAAQELTENNNDWIARSEENFNGDFEKQLEEDIEQIAKLKEYTDELIEKENSEKQGAIDREIA